jgi:hypothetical protein
VHGEKKLGERRAADAWHFHVGQKQVDLLRFRPTEAQRLGGTLREQHPISVAREDALGGLAHRRFVVHQENRFVPAH